MIRPGYSTLPWGQSSVVSEEIEGKCILGWKSYTACKIHFA